MLNSVNLKKLTAKALIGIVLAGSLVTIAGTKQAVASDSCSDGNRGGGNDPERSATLPSGEMIVVENFDPSNQSKRGQLKTGLMNGNTRQNGMNIAYSNGAFRLTSEQADSVIDKLGSNASGSLSPNTFTATVIEGQTVSLNRSVTINCIPDIVSTETVSEDRKVDVLFLADNTNSMTDAINNIKTNATTLLNTLSTTYGDVQFGVARYYGDPRERTGASERICQSYVWGRCWEWGVRYTDEYFGATGAYQLQKAVGSTQTEVIAAINQWQASSRNTDWEEGNFFALHQAATNGATVNGYGTGFNTGWRSDAKKVIVWFGDAFSHEDTINKTNTIQALKNNGITVVAINADTKTYSYSGHYLSSVRGLDYQSQASSIATETGGVYANANPSALSNTILSLVGNALVESTGETTTAGTVNLTFQALGDTSGLNITYTCTDSRGCNDVVSGQTRDFRMDVEGVTAGTYDFKTIVSGVGGAVGNDEVTVTNLFAD